MNIVTSSSNYKFMQTLSEYVYLKLERMAKERGVTIQELLRAIVIPEWLQTNSPSQVGKLSAR